MLFRIVLVSSLCILLIVRVNTEYTNPIINSHICNYTVLFVHVCLVLYGTCSSSICLLFSHSLVCVMDQLKDFMELYFIF